MSPRFNSIKKACGVFIPCFSLSTMPAVQGAELVQAPKAETSSVTQTQDWLPKKSAKDYSYSYWLNGWRKSKDDTSKDLLSFETGYFGFTLDIEELAKPSFGLFDDQSSIISSLNAGTKRVGNLSPAELIIELEEGGETYRMVSCRAGQNKNNPERLGDVVLLESGKFVQKYRIEDAIFKNDQGKELKCYSQLFVRVWPDSINLTTKIQPSIKYSHGAADGIVGQGFFQSSARNAPEKILATELAGGNDSLTMEFWFRVPDGLGIEKSGHVLTYQAQSSSVVFEASGSQLFEAGGGKINCKITTPQGKTYALSTRNLAPGAWNHIVLSREPGGVIELFLNGERHQSIKVNEVAIEGKGELRLSPTPSPNRVKRADIILDEIKVWNRPFDQSDVSQAHALENSNTDGLIYENTFDTEEYPRIDIPQWENAKLTATLKTDHETWSTSKEIAGTWKIGEIKSLTLNCNVIKQDPGIQKVGLEVSMRDGEECPVEYCKDIQAWAVTIPKKRNNLIDSCLPGGYSDFTISVDNPSAETVHLPVHILLLPYLRGINNSLIICYPDGTPTGIPVQLVKHHGIRPYFYLPAPSGKSTYLMRYCSAYYGTLPAATCGQDTLDGFGGNGLWIQYAIKSRGETMTMDPVGSIRPNSICDVRAVYIRDGKDGPINTWQNGQWGGDWLDFYDENGEKLWKNDSKTALIAQGPCLTETKHFLYYGKDRSVRMDADIRFARIDDYAKMFFTIRYEFLKPVPTKNGSFFRMGMSHIITPYVAYGNKDGLIKSIDVPRGLESNSTFIEKTELQGESPWWVARTANYRLKESHPMGTSNAVIRSCKYVIGGKEYHNPHVSFDVSLYSIETPGLDMLLVPPAGVEQMNPGDTVEFELQWIILPRVADDYYGPNEALRNHLEQHPRSWETVYREAVGNDLKVKVEGGVVENNFPLIISTDADTVSVDIEGGVGHAPIQFKNLKSARGYTLYQIVNGEKIPFDQSTEFGNDFWQTDYDAESNSYRRTYNIPLDGLAESKWQLERSGK